MTAPARTMNSGEWESDGRQKGSKYRTAHLLAHLHRVRKSNTPSDLSRAQRTVREKQSLLVIRKAVDPAADKDVDFGLRRHRPFPGRVSFEMAVERPHLATSLES